jgi:Asp-tRNA(Asn)/Glu-tRNA(Gln) amidotransferase A subunit family amidase
MTWQIAGRRGLDLVEREARAGALAAAADPIQLIGSPEPGSLMPQFDRRTFVAKLSTLGVGGVFADALWAGIQEQERITAETIADAEVVAGLEFTPEERELMVRGLNQNLEAYDAIRQVTIPNQVSPAVQFDPRLPTTRGPVPDEGELGGGPTRVARRFDRVRVRRQDEVRRPDRLEEVAFWPVARLSELIRTGQVTSLELTELYLDRLRRYGPTLEAVITVTEELALRQARRADAELATGFYRGPLHGIPWGAKDLLSTEDYRTTWGAKPYEEQRIPEDATVLRRLEDAGAVLVAKLTLGALAMGDVWYGGKTRNPWDPEQGSSGSSAGSAAATVAGLVGFGIGTETLGSIVSPCTRTGASGLRPTFGRVARSGAMALSWSMDKIGPICRSAEDCALVFAAIHGADGRDPTARTVPFDYDGDGSIDGLRVGYLRSGFEREPEIEDEERRARVRRQIELENQALDAVRSLGVDPVPVKLPETLPVGALRIILSAEAAAAFDDLTRSGRDDLLVSQEAWSWPNSFRSARMIPAVEYIQANRVRTMLMGEVERAMADVDVFITPSYAGDVLLTTNLTGHPTVVAPAGFIEGHPMSISFVGGLWKDDAAVRLAAAYQSVTDFHRRVPAGFA